MTSAWDRAKNIADKHTSAGSLFVRLQNDGDKVIGAFVGEPAARELHWVDSKYEECVGDACPRCAAGAKPSFRVMFNFYVPAEGAMRIIEGGTMFFGAVLGIRDKYSLDGWLFEVKRIGKAKDPKTTYSVLPEKPIDEAMAATIREATPIAMHSPKRSAAHVTCPPGEPLPPRDRDDEDNSYMF
jgi:hypothetical protein